LPGFFFGLRLRGIFAALESKHHGTADDSDRDVLRHKGNTEWNIASDAFYVDDLAIHR
jgi:hypothetical protein